MNARRRSPKRKNWPDNLYQKADGYFWYRNPEKNKYKGLGRDKLAAFEAADAANAELASRKRQALVEWVRGGDAKTLKVWALEYQDQYIAERERAQNTIAGLKSRIRFICAAEFAVKQLGAVTTLDVSNYIRDVENSRGARTAMQTRTTLHDIFRAAAERGLVDVGSNPVSVVRKPKAEVTRDRLSLEQFLAIRVKAENWLVNAMNLALLSGQRRDDVANAMFDDCKEGYWYCKQGKTGTKLRIPLSIRLDAVGLSLADVVKQCRDSALSKYLIHHAKTRANVKAGAQLNVTSISKAFAAARDAAGITQQDGKTPPSFHEIRSLSERLYEKEKGGSFTQKLLGHKSAAMTARYHDVRGSEWIDVAAG